MSFRQSFDVLHETIGAYVAGVFVPGVRSVLTIQATVQPVTGQDLITAPEGRRINDMVKVYTNASLQESDEGTSLQPDMIVWRGNAYEVSAIDVRQMGVINHYKVVASRRMKVPTDYAAQWVAGTLNRG